MSLAYLKAGGYLSIPNLIVNRDFILEGQDLQPENVDGLTNIESSDGSIIVSGITGGFDLSSNWSSKNATSNVNMANYSISLCNTIQTVGVDLRKSLNNGTASNISVDDATNGLSISYDGGTAGVAFDTYYNKPTLNTVSTFTDDTTPLLIQPTTTFNKYLIVGNGVTTNSSVLQLCYANGLSSGENIQIVGYNGQLLIQQYNRTGRTNGNMLILNPNGTMQISDGVNVGNVYDSYFNKPNGSVGTNNYNVDTLNAEFGDGTYIITENIEVNNLIDQTVYPNSQGTGSGGFLEASFTTSKTGDNFSYLIEELYFTVLTSASKGYTGDFQFYLTNTYVANSATANANTNFLNSLSDPFTFKVTDCLVGINNAGTTTYTTNATQFVNNGQYLLQNVKINYVLPTANATNTLYLFLVQVDLTGYSASYTLDVNSINSKMSYSLDTITESTIQLSILPT